MKLVMSVCVCVCVRACVRVRMCVCVCFGCGCVSVNSLAHTVFLGSIFVLGQNVVHGPPLKPIENDENRVRGLTLRSKFVDPPHLACYSKANGYNVASLEHIIMIMPCLVANFIQSLQSDIMKT